MKKQFKKWRHRRRVKFLLLQYLFNFVLIVLVILGILSWGLREKERRASYSRGENMVYNLTDVLGVASKEYSMSVDFTQIERKASTMLFGGSNPRKVQDSAFDKMDELGIQAIRVPFFIEHAIPKNSSIASFKKNDKNIQNINSWNRSILDERKRLLREAKERGMTTLGIIDYTPAWLNQNGVLHGVPQDWEVYEKIVEMVYADNRDLLDYVEIWNEPDYVHFLNTSGTSYSQEDAYIQIYLHASKAIRNYDKKMNDGKSVKIGGPALSKLANYRFLSRVLANKELKDSIDFISIHNYDKHHDLEITDVKNILKDNNLEEIPIFLTEWNYSPEERNFEPQMISYEAIPYVADRFIDMLKQGIKANFFFAMQPLEYTSQGYGHGSLAFFEPEKEGMEPMQKAKTWKLFSDTMGVGKGPFDIVMSSEISSIKTLAIVNSEGHNVIIVSNSTNVPITVNVKTTHADSSRKYVISAYSASKQEDTITKNGDLNKKSANNNLEFKVFVPEKSVVGTTIQASKGFSL